LEAKNNPITKNTINTTIKIKNKTLAISPATDEILVKPKSPATTEMIKKITAHFNIIASSVFLQINKNYYLDT
jgi:hypothetical protein